RSDRLSGCRLMAFTGRARRYAPQSTVRLVVVVIRRPFMDVLLLSVWLYSAGRSRSARRLSKDSGCRALLARALDPGRWSKNTQFRMRRERENWEHWDRDPVSFLRRPVAWGRQPDFGTGDPCSGRRPSGSIGRARSLTPQAAKIALPIAGATPTIGVSPAPAGGRSLRSRMTTVSSGTSENRGTLYCEKRGFSIRPSPNRTDSKRAPPIPCSTAPSTWLRTP